HHEDAWLSLERAKTQQHSHADEQGEGGATGPPRHQGSGEAGVEASLGHVEMAGGTKERGDNGGRQGRRRDLTQDALHPWRNSGHAVGKGKERGPHGVRAHAGEENRGPHPVHGRRHSASTPATMPTAAPTTMDSAPAPSSAA